MSINTYCTDQIICPFCGYAFDESYEYIGETSADCPNCEKIFDLETDEYVEYTTTKPNWLRRWRAYSRDTIHRRGWYEWIAEHGDD